MAQGRVERLARRLFLHIPTELNHEEEVAEDKRDRVVNELVYLYLFLVDLSVYTVWKDSPQRQQAMDSFWQLVEQSGLNMSFVNMRMQSYEAAVPAQTTADSWRKVGAAFARNCLAPADGQIADVGAKASKRMFEAVLQVIHSS